MNRPLRIIHVYNELDPKNGGPPHVIVGLVAGQMDDGHHVTLISEDPHDCRSLDEFLDLHLKKRPRRVSIQPNPIFPVLTQSAVDEALMGADIVHIHGIWPAISMCASRGCQRLNIPYVVAPHGSLHKGALMEKRVKKIIGMWCLGYGRYIANADALHMLNQDELSGAYTPLHLNVRLPKLQRVIPNGIFPEMLNQRVDLDTFRQQIPGLANHPYILFLSRLHRGKGLDLLLPAFAQVAENNSEVHLVIVGQDQGEQKTVEDLARTLNVRARVHLLGPLYDERKYAAYAGADVFCLPSRHEGFSMAITEAMAWSRPVVVTKACHFPEVSERGCGVEVHLSADALARGLLQVLDDPRRAQSMGQRGHALVMDKYTWPRVAQKTVELYHEVIQSRRDA